MVPKINFKWSFIYQQTIHSPQVRSEEFDLERYEKEVRNFIKELEKAWGIKREKILSYMEEISGLKWKKQEIDCYVIKRSRYVPISNPLTIPIELETDNGIASLSTEDFIDMLVHELTHQIFIQNEERIDDYLSYLKEKYSSLSFKTKIHIPLHAIHKKIFRKFFDKERLEKELEKVESYPDYKKSWEIVNNEGEDKILEELMERIK